MACYTPEEAVVITVTLVFLVALFTYGVVVNAMYCGGSICFSRITIRELVVEIAVDAIEVLAFFYLASESKSSLVLAAAWVTLLFDIVGVIYTATNYGKQASPRLWLVWLAIASDAAMIVVCVYGYTTVI
ncbi:MAG TPA: hypothetical protein VLF64_00620 [Candidatus Saccharimonadales bacterium]|nr:hypothetical protein [Candidatus Saccharimonadales bacterium]